MPTFLELKQNSPAEIISTKNYRTAMISNWQQHNNKFKTPMIKVTTVYERSNYVRIKIDKVYRKIDQKFIVFIFCLYMESAKAEIPNW